MDAECGIADVQLLSNETLLIFPLSSAIVRNVAQVAKRVGARFVSLSAIGADPDSSIPYFRSKGRGEAAIKTICFDNALILRPSIVFGPGDSFFNVKEMFRLYVLQVIRKLKLLWGGQ